MTSHPTHPSVVIRAARGSDSRELLELAELDSAPALAGQALVAEIEGRIVAARGIHSGASIADPFVPTAGLLDLLELRARPALEPRDHRFAWPHRARVA